MNALGDRALADWAIGDWALAPSAPGGHEDPAGIAMLEWQALPEAMPVAAARQGISNAELDAQDWWYRTVLHSGTADRVVLESVATIADVFLDGHLVAHSESMFRAIEIPLTPGRDHALAVCCRALAPELARRRRPRARWRTRLVSDGNLRFHRTMLLGRAPGFAAGPAAVGLCSPVRLSRCGAVDSLRVRARLEGSVGVINLIGAAPDLIGAELLLTGPTGEHRGQVGDDLRISDVALWWPHTHGTPNRYTVWVNGQRLHQVGFRRLDWPEDWEQSGFRLRLNDVELFCRGAVWTPLDLTRLGEDPGGLAQRLKLVCAAGMNMLRIPGIARYESDLFYELCDELGILVWQDMMFANLDYPDSDPNWVAEVEAEATFQLDRLAGRPSFAVLCGGSECAQQVTMLGLDPALARGPLYTEILPRALDATASDVAYVPNSPWGGHLPFRPAGGVANYYGVGAYLRDITDARLSQVSFAGECLAFSNVGEVAELTKAGIPRDSGAGWDFEDVRDHYLTSHFGVDAVALRWSDPGRYLELSRTVTGEVMAEVMGIWRSGDTPTAGALLLWLADLSPGSGWGIIDSEGRPKAAHGRLAQALAPRAVWLTDAGLNGIVVHVANDSPDPLDATLRIALYRDGEIRTGAGERTVSLPGHAALALDLEELLGRFVDVNWAYRFGPPAQDLIVASLEDADGIISAASAFPVGRPLAQRRVEDLGLSARADHLTGGDVSLTLGGRRVLHGVRVRAGGWQSDLDVFTLEPGHPRTLRLERADGPADPVIEVSAINLFGSLRITPSAAG